MSSSELLHNVSLRDQAAESIRAGITAGEFEPGEIYSATMIAERFGVSATPVREAMLDLASVGLVEAVRNRGFRVLTVSETDLDEINEIRLFLEPPMVRKVAESASDEQIAALEQHVVDIEAAASSTDVERFLIADRRFHLQLLELAGNHRLTRLVGQLRDQTRLFGLAGLAKKGNLTASAGEHRDIFEALRDRRGEDAFALTHAHLEHARGIWAGLPE